MRWIDWTLASPEITDKLPRDSEHVLKVSRDRPDGHTAPRRAGPQSCLRETGMRRMVSWIRG